MQLPILRALLQTKEANLSVRMIRGVSQATHMPVQRPKPEERRRKGR